MFNLSERVDGTLLMVLITMVNATSMAWFGYDQGVFSGVLISKDFKKHFPETLDSDISGITSSSFALGAFFGAIFAFTLGDRLGRKKTVAVGLTTNFIGAILQIVAWHLPQMLIGRVINGFGMGVSSSTCPVFQAECSKPRIRGKLVVVGSLCNTAAFCLANWMNYALFFQGGPLQWRFPLALQLVFPIVVATGLLLVPESPRWLMLKDRPEEARRVIARLLGKNLSIDNPEVTDEFLSIQASLHIEHADRVGVMDVLRCRDKTQNLRRVLLSCGTQFMQQFSGVNALGYYLPTLLQQSLGYNEQKSRLLTGVNGTIYLFSAFCCLLLIDNFGRRKMMMYGASTMGSCYLIASMCLRVAQKDADKEAILGRVVTAMFFLYYFFYGTSFAKVPWVYNSEINSIGWRTRGAAAATATNWMGGFIVTQFTKTGVDNLKWGFYLIFAVICWCYFPVVYILYPETTRRTLEDMDQIFIQNPSLVVCGKPDLTNRERPVAFIEAEESRIAAAGTAEKEGTQAAHVEDHNCIDADVTCQYDDTPSQRIDTSGGSREILARLRHIEMMLDSQAHAVASLSSELQNRRAQEDVQGTSPQSLASSQPSIARHLNAPNLAWTPGYDPQNSATLPPMDIPVKHKTSSNYLLGLPAMKALVGEYPKDLFFLLESRHALPPQLSFETLQGTPPELQITRELADYLVSTYFSTVHANNPILDEASFRNLYLSFLKNGVDSSVEWALCLVVFALSTVVTASPESTDFSASPPGMQYMEHALPILLSLSSWSFTYSIVLAQALVLASLYFAYIVRPLQSWRLIYSASTIIQFKLSG
ncbi:uncharacterized protein DNG_09438 [Cephalotrichum gorgonifer]|uniref:Major facilitator superfamily (MFS) profile domain-containing protein n=1 Tax=Cephalotrichum gorgonifer TaxID=2041049 RepID=A0AAE8N6X0_9PEZI|nr:uncharacterized protein DNG_09438 [Cephalotrichum gorgonifer]